MPAQNPRYPKPDGCRGCALEHSGFGFALPSGPPAARIRLVGESLGWEEAIAGEAFYGSAGGVLSRLLVRAGIDRASVRIANTISCRPPGDFLVGAPYEYHAITQCRQYLQPVLDEAPPDSVIVPLGATALDAVLGLAGVPGVAVKDFHGTVTRMTQSADHHAWVVPTYHPSHLQRGAMNLLDVVTQDLRLAARIAAQGFQRTPAQLVVDPEIGWFDRWVDDHLARLAQDPDGVHLSLDTEFPEKLGADESEIDRSDTLITRVNVGNDRMTGVTVRYIGGFRVAIERLLAGVAAHGGWVWLWNKYVDWDKLRQAGHTLDGCQAIDGMWLWKYLQSDLPRGLGFVAPMASDFGAWKHWGKDPAKEGEYAAADGLQNWRVCMWLLRDAHAAGLWDVFMRDWHERDQYVLRPAQAMGVPVNRQTLEAFHQELQTKLASVLVRMKETAAQGVLKPKGGYARRPPHKPPSWWKACTKAKHETVYVAEAIQGGPGAQWACRTCGEAYGYSGDPTPPASILGKSKQGGGEAKSQYMIEGVQLVEREVEVEVRACVACGAEDVGAKHKCPQPKAVSRRSKSAGSLSVAGDVQPVPRRVADLVTRRARRVRYFWQLPFNPDAPAQILAYLQSQGIDAPIDKKTQRATTNRKALEALRDQHADDPFFQLQMDWKAVQKVDSTYAVGTLSRLDSDNRVHPEITPKPSTLRDSCVNPNLQNCLRKGTLVEIVRDVSAHPRGIPIEDVRVGDWAYTFDHAGRLTLRQVTAVLAQGSRPLVRVHWFASRRTMRRGYTDMTVDHLVRLASGQYLEAGSLTGGMRVCSLGRCDDGQGYEILCATGMEMVREHRFVWCQLHPGSRPDHVHHLNENKKDNRPVNLEGIAVGDHVRHHNTGAKNAQWDPTLPRDPKERRRAIQRRSRQKRFNHQVVSVEILNLVDAVYDLTIDETHNFIAGELAVHNCVADKAGPDGLASGFRRAVEARSGVPPGVTAAELAAWERRWM